MQIHPPSSNSSVLQIGIIGAGTAGLAAAIAFAKAGHAVRVLEKHSALTHRGAGLLIQPQGVRALEELGVGAVFDDVSVPIDRLHGVSHRGWTLVDVPYPGKEARGGSRGALSGLLFKAASDAGAAFQFDSEVTDVQIVGTRAAVFCGERRELFDLVVLADGAGAVLPAKAGLAVTSKKYEWGALWGMFDVDSWQYARVLEQRFATTSKMFGLMPTARVGNKWRLSFFWSLPCADYPAWQKSSLEDWKRQLLDLWPESAPVVSQITAHDQLAFATYRHARANTLALPPICVLGDAAHAMSPQLGLGTTLAVQDALELAKQVSLHGAADGAIQFSKTRLRTVRSYQLLSALLTPCFQSHGGGIWRDVAFAVGLRVPGVRQLMYRSVAEPGGPAAVRKPA